MTPLDRYFKATRAAGQALGRRKLNICDSVSCGPERQRQMDAAQATYDRAEARARKALYALPYDQWT